MAQEMTVPVAGKADVLVLGASFAGSACAVELAKTGFSVFLVDAGTMPGREMTATLRYWTTAGKKAAGTPASEWLERAAAPGRRGGETPIVPDRLKRAIEDSLLSAGVRLIYASRAVGPVLGPDGTLAGGVIANKGGAQAILSRTVVDATEWAMFARMTEAGLDAATFPMGVSARRVLEYSGVKGRIPGKISAPAELGLCGDAVSVHPGSGGAGHFLLEYTKNYELGGPNFRFRNDIEISARKDGIRLARWLAGNARGFSGAWLAGSSLKLQFPSPWKSPKETGGCLQDGRCWLIPDSTCPEEAAANGASMAREIAERIRSIDQAGSPEVQARIGWGEGRTFSGGELSMRDATLSGITAQRIPCNPGVIPAGERPEVVVAGGGTSGAVASAVSASRGAKTILLEMNRALGGTGTVGAVDSYWFGLRNGFTAEVDRRYGEIASSINAAKREVWNIEARIQALLEWNLEAGAEVLLGCVVFGAVVERGRLKGVLCSTPDGPEYFQSPVVVDATGDGDVAFHAGAEYTYGSARDRVPMWYSLGAIREPGKPLNNFTSTVDVSDPADYTRAVLAGRRRYEGYDHATYLAPRESRHITCDVTLSLSDLNLLRHHPDTVCVCFSNIDIKGKSSSDHVAWGLLPPNSWAEIPYRALLPRGLDGIIVAGKAYSCTQDFVALARMQADMQNLGGAAGIAAALAVKNGITPRGIPTDELKALLGKAGAFPEGYPRKGFREGGVAMEELVRAVSALTGKEPLFSEQTFEEQAFSPAPVALVMEAGGEAVPPLLEAFRSSTGERRLLLARLLAWHGSAEGVPAIMEAVSRDLSGARLPTEGRILRWGGMAPDQGVMPDCCYLLRAAALTGDRSVLPALDIISRKVEAEPDDFRDRHKGSFYYVDTVCLVAERLADPGAIPALELLHARPALRDMVSSALQGDFFLERRALLELCIGRAMARCGSVKGVEILAAYLSDSRAILAGQAYDELRDITGASLPPVPSAWRDWAGGRESIPPKPYMNRLG